MAADFMLIRLLTRFDSPVWGDDCEAATWLGVVEMSRPPCGSTPSQVHPLPNTVSAASPNLHTAQTCSAAPGQMDSKCTTSQCVPVDIPNTANPYWCLGRENPEHSRCSHGLLLVLVENILLEHEEGRCLLLALEVVQGAKALVNGCLELWGGRLSVVYILGACRRHHLPEEAVVPVTLCI